MWPFRGSNMSVTMTYHRDDIGEHYTGDIHFYSCRAECQQDVLDFITALLKQSNRILHVFMMPDGKLPDTLLEFGLQRQDDETLIRLLESQSDAHVMVESLRRCKLEENSLQRLYDPYPLRVVLQ